MVFARTISLITNQTHFDSFGVLGVTPLVPADGGLASFSTDVRKQMLADYRNRMTYPRIVYATQAPTMCIQTSSQIGIQSQISGEIREEAL